MPSSRRVDGFRVEAQLVERLGVGEDAPRVQRRIEIGVVAVVTAGIGGCLGSDLDLGS